MEQGKATKQATRDYQALSEAPWQLWETMYARRSHRKYLPLEPDDELFPGLRQVVELACAARGAAPESIIPVTAPAEVTEVRKRAYKGLSGKINIWLIRAPLAAELVINLPASDVHAERPVDLLKTVMAVEDAVLWLTEKGLGTCWLAGVSEREIKAGLRLAEEQAVPAIISVGKPALSVPKTVSYGGVSYHMMSRRRKPLSRIACREKTSVPYEEPDLSGEGFSAVQGDVEGLLESLRDGKAGAAGAQPGLDLTIDACLEAGRIAPSANNSQPWQFVVVRDKDRLAELAGLSGESGGSEYRVAIVAAGLSRRIESLMEKPFWAIDVPIAMSHVSLMAASMGYMPSVVTDGIDETGVGKLVGLASGMRVVCFIGLR